MTSSEQLEVNFCVLVRNISSLALVLDPNPMHKSLFLTLSLTALPFEEIKKTKTQDSRRS